MDVPKEECLRRAVGRRIDPKTNRIFHLEDNPPPIEESPLMENLISLSDPLVCEETLVDKHADYDKNLETIENWFNLFGFIDPKINTLQKFDGTGHVFDVFNRIDSHIIQILEYKQKIFEQKILDSENQKQKEIEVNIQFIQNFIFY